MVVCHNVAVVGDNHTRAKAALHRLVVALLLTGLLTFLWPEKEIKHSERVVASAIAIRVLALCCETLDTNHCIHGFFGGYSEVCFKRSSR